MQGEFHVVVIVLLYFVTAISISMQDLGIGEPICELDV